jgi:hypothetical protein
MVCLPQKPTYVPWRHGEMVIVSSSRTEDPRFDFPPGYKVFWIVVMLLVLWLNLHCYCDSKKLEQQTCNQ